MLVAAVLAFSAVIFPAQATQPDAEGDHKVWVCHATGSQKNPYVIIHIDQAGWDNGHMFHEGDFGPFDTKPESIADCRGGPSDPPTNT